MITIRVGFSFEIQSHTCQASCRRRSVVDYNLISYFANNDKDASDNVKILMNMMKTTLVFLHSMKIYDRFFTFSSIKIPTFNNQR